MPSSLDLGSSYPRALTAAAALAWLVAGACTQDFDQFTLATASSATGSGGGGGDTGPGGAGASGTGAAGASGGGAASGGDGGGGNGPGGAGPGGSGPGGGGQGGQGGASGGMGGGGMGGGGMGGAPGCPVGSSCVPAIMAGEHAVGAPGVQACPAGWAGATVVTDGVDPGCTGCGCGGPVNGACAPGDVHRRGANDCTAELQTFANLTDGQCVDINTGASGFVVEEPTPSGGGCEPTPSSPIPIVQGTVCTAPAGAPCGAGMVCVPDSAAPFSPACNLLPGNVACPAALPAKILVYATAMDTRVCDCNCGMPQGAGCPGASIQLFASNTCANAALATLVADGACNDTQALNSNSSFLVEAGTWSAASCPSQTNHSGGVAFSGDVSLCCQP